MKLLVGFPAQCEHAAGEPVGGTDELVRLAVDPLRPQTGLRIPRIAQPRRALAPQIEPPGLAGEVVHRSRGEHRSRTAPRQLAPLVVGVCSDQFGQPIGVRPRGREPLQRQSDAGLAQPQTRRVIRVREIGLVRLLEVGDVVPAQLDQPSALQRVERLNDAGSADMDRPKPVRLLSLLLDVPRVGRPAVVERSVRVLGDRTDRGMDESRLPSVAGHPLVGVGLEEHVARLTTA